MDWSTKKFHYKIVRRDEKGRVVGYVHKKLSELEDFVEESRLQVESLIRTGPNSFTVEVTAKKEWFL